MKQSKNYFIAVVLLAIVLGVGVNTSAQTLTEEQGKAILEELAQIRRLLERQLASSPAQPLGPAVVPVQRARVSIQDTPMLGRREAPLTLVEFTDLECPFCRQFHLTTFEQLKKEYIDTGVLRFISRDLPLPIHRNALRAAHAARCSGEQNRFWEMRRTLIVNAQSLAAERLPVYAGDLGLDVERFNRCLEEGRHEAAVQRDMDDARGLGITGTPTFVLGPSAADAIEGFRIVGAQPYATFTTRIKELLESFR
jgi:protein-disulfide isomerase